MATTETGKINVIFSDRQLNSTAPHTNCYRAFAPKEMSTPASLPNAETTLYFLVQSCYRAIAYPPPLLWTRPQALTLSYAMVRMCRLS